MRKTLSYLSDNYCEKLVTIFYDPKSYAINNSISSSSESKNLSKSTINLAPAIANTGNKGTTWNEDTKSIQYKNKRNVY